MTKRTLSLSRETLTELTVSELGGVAGGAGYDSLLSCPVRDCLRDSYRICLGTENCVTLIC